MRKIVYVLASFVLIVSFQNCGNGEFVLKQNNPLAMAQDNTTIGVEVPIDLYPIDGEGTPQMPPTSKAVVTQVNIRNAVGFDQLLPFQVLSINLESDEVRATSLSGEEEINVTNCYSEQLANLKQKLSATKLCFYKEDIDLEGRPIACPMIARIYSVDMVVNGQNITYGYECGQSYLAACEGEKNLVLNDVLASFRTRAESCLSTQ